jgi:hypothetical protein
LILRLKVESKSLSSVHGTITHAVPAESTVATASAE